MRRLVEAKRSLLIHLVEQDRNICWIGDASQVMSMSRRKSKISCISDFGEGGNKDCLCVWLRVHYITNVAPWL